MNNIQIVALAEINILARQIRSSSRTIYKSRIIEFLTDIIREQSMSNLNYLLRYCDNAEKLRYSSMFVDIK